MGFSLGSWIDPRPPLNKENQHKQDGQTLSNTNNHTLTSNRCDLSRDNCEFYMFRIVRIFLGSWVLLPKHDHPTGGGESSTTQLFEFSCSWVAFSSLSLCGWGKWHHPIFSNKIKSWVSLSSLSLCIVVLSPIPLWCGVVFASPLAVIVFR